MTLADLAAMAATVKGFVRPESRMCSGCGYEMGYCACSEEGPEWDNSPAALAMAVLRCGVRSEVHFSLLFRKSWRSGERAMDVALRSDGSGNPVWMDMAVADTDESIARALLTALLRAHGVEVPGE